MYCCLNIFRVACDNLGLGGSKEFAQDSATFSTRNLLSRKSLQFWVSLDNSFAKRAILALSCGSFPLCPASMTLCEGIWSDSVVNIRSFLTSPTPGKLSPFCQRLAVSGMGKAYLAGRRCLLGHSGKRDAPT